MRKLLLTTTALMVMAGESFGADLRSPITKAPTAVPPVFDWSGFYIGVDGGWQGSRIGLSNPTPDPPFPLTYEPHHNSGAVGGFGGAQSQIGQIVLGIEGGYLAGFGQASLGVTPPISIFVPSKSNFTGTAQAKLRDLWSIGGRVGWAAGSLMPYVTGGFANGSFQFDAQDEIKFTERARAKTVGGYIGVGVDWAVTTNWILGVEYRHYAFSDKTVTGVVSGQFPRFPESVRFAPSTDTVMGRLSYKFNPSLR